MMTTKTKVKAGVLHPSLDLSELDPRVVERLMTGQPFIVAKTIRRNGQVFEPGDEIVLGSHKNDDVLLRRHPITGAAFAVLPDRYYWSKLDGARKGYERKVLFELRNNVNAFQRDMGAIKGRVGLLKQQLRQAQGEQKNIAQALKIAEEKLAQAEADIPVLEDFLPSTNGQE